MPVFFFSHKPKLTKKLQNDIRQLVIGQGLDIFQIHLSYLQSVKEHLFGVIIVAYPELNVNTRELTCAI